MNELLARLWRIGKPFQGWIAWFVNAKFACGVTGVVRTDDGRVLLLRHRLWGENGQWGFPSGYVKRGERHQDTIVREVREETGLTVTVGGLLEVRSGYRYKIEVYYQAALVGGLANLVLDDREILEARLFALDSLPRDMPALHRELAARG
jgi:8-oxo-dGTP diphosphatase